MANFSSYFLLNRMVLALTISSFTPVAAFSGPNYQMQMEIEQ
jgi:hypothetical protein